MIPIGSRLLNKNGANVCFINSTLQALLATFPSGEFKKKQKGLDDQFVQILDQIRADPLAPGQVLDLRPALPQFGLQTEFPLGVQHDAFQFLCSLLGTLSKKARSLFTIDQNKTRICLKCGDNFQKQMSDLGLAVNMVEGQAGRSVQSLIKHGLSDELVRDFRCKCDSKSAVVLRTEITKVPDILVVALQRSQTAREKDRRSIKMNMKCKIEVNNRQAKYEVTAMIAHLGDSPKQGHYVAAIHNYDNVWIHYDDTHRQILSTEAVQKQFGKDMYLLFYTKKV